MRFFALKVAGKFVRAFEILGFFFGFLRPSLRVGFRDCDYVLLALVR